MESIGGWPRTAREGRQRGVERVGVDEVIEVECYAGASADETPRAVVHGDRRLEVWRVTDRWIAESADPAGGRRQWFRVMFRGGATAAIYHDLALDMWFLSGAGPDRPRGAGEAPAA